MLETPPFFRPVNFLEVSLIALICCVDKWAMFRALTGKIIPITYIDFKRYFGGIRSNFMVTHSSTSQRIVGGAVNNRKWTGDIYAKTKRRQDIRALPV